MGSKFFFYLFLFASASKKQIPFDLVESVGTKFWFYLLLFVSASQKHIPKFLRYPSSASFHFICCFLYPWVQEKNFQVFNVSVIHEFYLSFYLSNTSLLSGKPFKFHKLFYLFLFVQKHDFPGFGLKLWDLSFAYLFLFASASKKNYFSGFGLNLWIPSFLLIQCSASKKKLPFNLSWNRENQVFFHLLILHPCIKNHLPILCLHWVLSVIYKFYLSTTSFIKWKIFGRRTFCFWSSKILRRFR